MAASLDHIQIPSYATRLHSHASTSVFHHTPKIASAPPKSETSTLVGLSSRQLPQSPKSAFNIPSAILASGIAMPSPSPRNPRNAPNLTSTKDPLSLPTTTSNFRRFAARCGPLFWGQDRAEEILMWRKGWKVTTAWMTAYAFLCYFPRLVLLIPHAILLFVLLSAHSARNPSPSRTVEAPSAPPYTQAPEGSPEWFSNLQAVQNLMGVVSDTHDFVLYSVVPHLTYATPYTYPLLVCTAISLLLLLPILPYIPLRQAILVLGLAPFAFTHPLTQSILPHLITPYLKHACVRIARLVDDDRLEDRHWRSGSSLREVELWENERFAPSATGGAWSKSALKPDERKGWTRGRDGWSDDTPGGGGDVSSNLMFQLAPGWAFVETEDWRKDLEATWIGIESDDEGWIYTNDAWLEPHSILVDEWKTSGATRRRRWIRRIYHDPSLSS